MPVSKSDNDGKRKYYIPERLVREGEKVEMNKTSLSGDRISK